MHTLLKILIYTVAALFLIVTGYFLPRARNALRERREALSKTGSQLDGVRWHLGGWAMTDKGISWLGWLLVGGVLVVLLAVLVSAFSS